MIHVHQKRFRFGRLTIALSIGAAILTTPLSAATVPFTEHFTEGTNNWFVDFAGTVSPNHLPAGGPDGSAYISTMLSFENLSSDSTPILFRGQDNMGSSGGAFVGDWIGEGVTDLQFFVRHDVPAPVNFFARIAPVGTNFPGGILLSFIPIPADTWTPISLAVDPANPALVLEGGTFGGIFGNVGKVQIGFGVPAGLAGVEETYTFDLDRVSLVPEPGTLVLMTLGAAGLALRRRRRVSA